MASKKTITSKIRTNNDDSAELSFDPHSGHINSVGFNWCASLKANRLLSRNVSSYFLQSTHFIFYLTSKVAARYALAAFTVMLLKLRKLNVTEKLTTIFF